MYAIVEIAGQQFKVSKDSKVYVHRLPQNEGDSVSFDKVLLVDNDGKVTLGAPAIKGASVEAKVLQHLKGDCSKIKKQLSWKPKYTFESMLDEMIEYWMDKLNN